MVFDISFEKPKGNFRFPKNEFWNLPLEIAFLFGDRVFRQLSGQNGCKLDSLGVFGCFRGFPIAFKQVQNGLIFQEETKQRKGKKNSLNLLV